MKILAIDPGPEQSAFIHWDPGIETTGERGIISNAEILKDLELRSVLGGKRFSCRVVIEMLACFGMPVGREVFQTALWIGKFMHACGQNEPVLVYRKDIKMHFCQSMKAKDSNIRQALIDRFGQPGTKKCPGMLYGIKADMWSALAIAVFYGDTNREEKSGHENIGNSGDQGYGFKRSEDVRCGKA